MKIYYNAIKSRYLILLEKFEDCDFTSLKYINPYVCLISQKSMQDVYKAVIYGKGFNNIITNFPAYYISEGGVLEICTVIARDSFWLGFKNVDDKSSYNISYKLYAADCEKLKNNWKLLLKI